MGRSLLRVGAQWAQGAVSFPHPRPAPYHSLGCGCFCVAGTVHVVLGQTHVLYKVWL